MRSLNENVQLLCKADEFNVWKDGRIIKRKDTPNYEEVYRMFGGRKTDRSVGRYVDYFMK